MVIVSTSTESVGGFSQFPHPKHFEKCHRLLCEHGTDIIQHQEGLACQGGREGFKGPAFAYGQPCSMPCCG